MVDQYLKITIDTPERIAEKQNDFQVLIKSLNDYLPGRSYVEIRIDDIAEMCNCKKEQILITY
jgi:hypothetical protein